MNQPTDDHHPLTTRRLLGGLALVALAVAVTFDIWADIFAIATRDEESSQVLLVPLVVAWLVWVRRDRWQGCRVRQTWIGPPLIAAGWLLSTIGYVASLVVPLGRRDVEGLTIFSLAGRKND
jgi:hypothetical protein